MYLDTWYFQPMHTHQKLKEGSQQKENRVRDCFASYVASVCFHSNTELERNMHKTPCWSPVHDKEGESSTATKATELLWTAVSPQRPAVPCRVFSSEQSLTGQLMMYGQEPPNPTKVSYPQL